MLSYIAGAEVVYDDNGVVEVKPEGLNYDCLWTACRQVDRDRNANRWLIGDLLNVSQVLGEDASQLHAAFPDMEPATLLQYERVSGRFPRAIVENVDTGVRIVCARREGVSWSRHREVMALPSEVAAQLLDARELPYDAFRYA